jgi:hypothetical protein
MIRVSVNPATLVAGRSAVLTIGLSNSGRDACSNVALRLKLPPGMALVSGRDKIEVDQIQPQYDHIHRVTVLPGGPGDFEVGISNFSYRDENGIPRREDNRGAPIRVLPAQGPPPEPPLPPPLPRLTVWDSGAKLALGQWDVLEVFLRNPSGPAVHDVTLKLAGPRGSAVQVEGSARIALLRDGETGRAAISVNVPDRGKVPVSVKLTYRYRDERGQVLLGTQDERLTVETAETLPPTGAVPPRHQGVPVTTILYLISQPRGMEQLSSYQEMREVNRLLWLSQNRERYRLQDCPAARLTDISQALSENWPQIVHFSGHGAEDGSLVVEDDFAYSSLINPAGLASLLGGFARSVRCVIVNACHSLALAELIVKEIDYVVGMRSAIGDYASVQFSVGFYQGLFAGKAVPEAFLQGKAIVQADSQTNAEYKTPVLLVRRNS